MHLKADSTDGEDKITHFRKRIPLYFETELAEKIRIGFVQQALNGIRSTVPGVNTPGLR
ncbi:hypothetical protein HMPREF3213_01600 [Heyndrickxia coagulans]|uniref:Uncharacterized protein n=1 Tax=Heyndrickxia coagulans TaxID=1398 RepID=A0A133KTD3_HEYCO|nr:hypothetical protein HMPREF3213_01600 [Heyndrickxia coagulans]